MLRISIPFKEGAISFASFKAMTTDERWALIKSGVKRVSVSVKTCQPNFIWPLYTNVPMPHYSSIKEGISVTLDEANVFNGTLKYRDNVTMSWKGYTCQLYDGELKMAPAREGATITGTCNGIAFAFAGVALQFGCWPGFLLLYQ
jgi:hypothetical protein